MSNLFINAIESIQVGIQDYGMNEPMRNSSAVRNIYAGTLLLAKELLCRRAPNADPDLVLAAKFQIKPDGKDGIEFHPQGQTTIDFLEINNRFKLFGIVLSQDEAKTLANLQRLRNDIEHKFTTLSHSQVQAQIAEIFPLIIKLIELCDEDPKALGSAFEILMRIKSLYDAELDRCLQSYQLVNFPFDELTGVPFYCNQCSGHLVVQQDPTNTESQSVDSICRQCGNTISAEVATADAIKEKHAGESHFSIMDGGDAVVDLCPECGLDTYVTQVGCVWCGEILGDCARCGVSLTPNTVGADNESFCDYCNHMINRND